MISRHSENSVGVSILMSKFSWLRDYSIFIKRDTNAFSTPTEMGEYIPRKMY